jgi:hypothetical protein
LSVFEPRVPLLVVLSSRTKMTILSRGPKRTAYV